jgi:formylglycine-generating enzyme required for sulfatase activity
MDKYPVTNREYQEFIRISGYAPDGLVRKAKLEPQKQDHPITGVTMADAIAYAKWANKRLPIEVEWLRAAYGDQELNYPWGDGFDGGKCNTLERSASGTAPVSEFPEGQSCYGVFDLAGNVWEWIPSGDARTGIVRGGSWRDTGQYASRKGRRTPSVITSSDHLGFRCARDVIVALSS